MQGDETLCIDLLYVDDTLERVAMLELAEAFFDLRYARPGTESGLLAHDCANGGTLLTSCKRIRANPRRSASPFFSKIRNQRELRTPLLAHDGACVVPCGLHFLILPLSFP